MPEIFLSWGFWYAAGGAIVAVAAILLVAILLVARGIEKQAARALAAARRVEEGTRPLWKLQGALETLEAILHRGAAIRAKTSALADSLDGPAPAESERRAG